jgi:hypothetical protein
MTMLNKLPSFSERAIVTIAIASLLLNVGLALAYIHYVVQVNNVFTIGADYKCTVKVSDWTSQEKLDEFGVQRGTLLGRSVGANLYWSEMIGVSKWSPIINITNTSPDKSENITWIFTALPYGVTFDAFIADPNGSTGVEWLSGNAGAKLLPIGASFNVVFSLYCQRTVSDGTFSFDFDIRCED